MNIQWFIYIEDEGDWPINNAIKDKIADATEARKRYLAWAERKKLPNHSHIWAQNPILKPGDITNFFDWGFQARGFKMHKGAIVTKGPHRQPGSHLIYIKIKHKAFGNFSCYWDSTRGMWGISKTI